jgi:hypothetical protein
VRAYGEGKVPEVTTVTQAEYNAEACKVSYEV